jgi:hypothetical protein
MFVALDPAWVQAASAVVIVVLTAALVGATVLYVRASTKLAREAKRTNDMAKRNAERMLLTNAPLLILVSGPQVDRMPEGGYAVSFTLTNGGSGVATELEIISDWNLPPFEAAIRRDAESNVGAIVEPPANAGPRPIVTGFRFTDQGGTRYQQPVRGRPSVVEP